MSTKLGVHSARGIEGTLVIGSAIGTWTSDPIWQALSARAAVATNQEVERTLEGEASRIGKFSFH